MATNKEELQKIIENKSLSPDIKAMGEAMLETEFAGDEIAQKMIRFSQILGGQSQAAAMSVGVDEDEVKTILRQTLEEEKISEDELDAVLQAKINAVPRQVTITTIDGKVKRSQSADDDAKYTRPLFQKILSDLEARNNVYLYGGAGTGKTFTAGEMARFLDWELIEVSCNQFTSPLELIGGQTIDGYQEGKAIRAWGNLNADGSPMSKKGAVLLLDELPKLDPNTAGILNALLAKVAEFDDNGEPKSIENGRGDKIRRGNLLVIATGNSLLNEANADYEANFKQDLSLQDRFVGSTYQVFVNVGFEWERILYKKWAFIFIYFNKLRNAIQDNKFQAKAFVSIRIMQSAQKTYQVFRTILDGTDGVQSIDVKSDAQASFTPAIGDASYEKALAMLQKNQVKTLKDTLDEFLILFNDEQRTTLKKETDYDGFLKIIEEKNRISLKDLNTASELREVETIISKAARN